MLTLLLVTAVVLVWVVVDVYLVGEVSTAMCHAHSAPPVQTDTCHFWPPQVSSMDVILLYLQLAYVISQVMKRSIAYKDPPSNQLAGVCGFLKSSLLLFTLLQIPLFVFSSR